MRHSTDICLLCNERNSSQKNSHIIPKFLGIGIFSGSKPRIGIAWLKGGKKEKVQDIIKEDFLFCPQCEKSFGVLETYCSLRLERYNDIRYAKNFKRLKVFNIEYIECEGIDIKIFNLFIYSIVWRVSICSNFAFIPFKLSIIDEEKLRIILKEFIKPKQTELFNSINTLCVLPEHSHWIARPNKKLRPPKSMLSAASYNDFIHQLHLVDYVLIYLTKQGLTSEGICEIDNNRLDRLVRIGLVANSNWEDFNRNMINEAIK